ncbi:hypothetical protein BH10ACI2_BH10ACI2_10670 [soil metagenome]
MKRQLSDEQLDKLMRSLMNDAAADQATVNDVADSAATWWGVQRQINAQKETARSPWPPILKFWRMALIGLPVAAAFLIAISFFAFVTKVANNDQAGVVNHQIDTFQPERSATESGPVETPSSAVVATKTKSDLPFSANRKTNPTRLVPAPKKAMSTSGAISKKSSEIKTDFIALSYARNPDSGQIVRVKVPSSMMVTLGLVATVEKPSSLVDAEVLVGDDGLSHAIRFIHQK